MDRIAHAAFSRSQAQNEAIERRNKFTLATSGGSLPKMLAKDLVNRTDGAVRWDKWCVGAWPSDERCER